MAVYGARKRKATAKRKARSKKAKPAEKRKKPKKAAAVRVRAAKRGKRSRPKKVRARRTRKRKVVRRPRVSATKKRIRKKIAAKRPAVRRARKKVAAKRPAAPARRKKVAARARPRPRKKITARTRKTKEQLQREHANITRQLEKIVAAEQKARETGKRSSERKEIRTKKKEVEERRAKRALVTKALPRSTPREQKSSLLSNLAALKKRFQEKFRAAKKSGELLKFKRLPSQIDSKRNTGEQRQLHFNFILRSKHIEDILYRVRKSAQTMITPDPKEQPPLWMSRMYFCGIGDRLLGSGARILMLDDKNPDADNQFFQTQGFDSSGVWPTLEGMMHSLEGQLNHYADLPNVVYLQVIQVLNFKHRRGP